MLPGEINTGGVQAASGCLGKSVMIQMDRHYPNQIPRTFRAVLLAVYPRGLLLARVNRGAREFVSFVDLFAGHVKVSGDLGRRLQRNWFRSNALEISLAASW